MNAVYKDLARPAELASAPRSLTFTISSEDVDSDGDRVLLSGWRLDRYRERPVVLWSHDPKVPAIAKTIDLGIRGNTLRAVAQFPSEGIHPLADTVFELARDGFIPSASVGFHSLERVGNTFGGVDHLRSELVEWSVCNVGANPAALIDASSRRVDEPALAKWLRAGRRALVPAGYRDLAAFKRSTMPCDRYGRPLADDVKILIDLDELRRPTAWQLDRQAEAGREAVVRRLRHEGWSGCPRGHSCPNDTATVEGCPGWSTGGCAMAPRASAGTRPAARI